MRPSYKERKRRITRYSPFVVAFNSAAWAAFSSAMNLCSCSREASLSSDMHSMFAWFATKKVVLPREGAGCWSPQTATTSYQMITVCLHGQFAFLSKGYQDLLRCGFWNGTL